MSLTKALTNSVSSSVLGSLLGANPSSTEVVAADWWASGSNWSYDWANDQYMAGGSTIYASFDDVPDTTVSVDSDGTYVNASDLVVDATANTPRLDYTHGSRMLLVEAQGTNLLPYSEALNQSGGAGFTAQDATVSANAASAPDGNTAADKLVENSSTARHDIFDSGGVSLGAGTYTVYGYFSAAGRGFAALQIAANNAADRYTVVMDLSDGSITDTQTAGSPSSNTYLVQGPYNGLYRLCVQGAHSSGTLYWVCATSDSGTPSYTASAEPTYAGDGSSGINIWGVEVKAGAIGDSYIPTPSSTSVTRSADALSRSLATTKTVYIEGRTGYGSGTEILWRADDGTSDNVKQVIRNSSNEIRVQVINSTTTVADVNIGTVADNTTYKIAARFETDDVNGALDGTAGTADTSCTMPTVTTEYMGQNTNGWFGKHTGYTSAENDASLEALTT